MLVCIYRITDIPTRSHSSSITRHSTIVKKSLLFVTLNCVIPHFLWVFLSNKPTLDADRTLFIGSLKHPAWVSYPKTFYAVFMDFPNKGVSNSVAFNFRKMQKNSLSLKRVPLNAFDGLRKLKEM